MAKENLPPEPSFSIEPLITARAAEQAATSWVWKNSTHFGPRDGRDIVSAYNTTPAYEETRGPGYSVTVEETRFVSTKVWYFFVHGMGEVTVNDPRALLHLITQPESPGNS